jgi:hypothetical protein
VKLLAGLRPRVASHQGGWDEVILFFGAPVTLFVLLRWLGIRRERREAAEQEADGAGGKE